MTGPTVSDLTRVFGRIGLLSFGGPAAQIALMHKELVEDRPWLTERQYLNALSFCMLLPGPEAMQLATYAGWRLHGTRGGLIAGLLFVLPGAVVILALASAYATYGSVSWVAAAFLGIKATVIVIVIQALLKLSRRALTRPVAYALALAAFVAIFALSVPFPLIILAAALIGALALRGAPQQAPPLTTSPTRTLGTIVLWATFWLAPLLGLWLFAPDLLSDIALFFATLALVTFGGAYAVLAYMVQEVVQGYGWLTTDQMIDALGLAETTPGPLILVTQFVGFLAGAQAGGWGMGFTAAIITLWVTFVPCFLWIFAGAPYVEWVATRPRLTGALNGITAAVVGVIANLSVWFALNVWFDAGTFAPEAFDPVALALSALAAILLLWRKWDLLAVLPLMATAGITASIFAGLI
ncbi:chromate efflux transporter [Gymnodinialimonas ulvae]|uniref:chromate efflux transporter n=1 Tax=Gymnodinialimonas ulvae TaxID=3126504 RepID=UPI0030AEA2D5